MNEAREQHAARLIKLTGGVRKQRTVVKLSLFPALVLGILACEVIDSDDFSSRLDRDEDGFDDIEFGGEDCDDTDKEINPEQAEIFYDDIDQNCNGNADDLDADGDGYPSSVYDGDDCDDTLSSINPAASEVCDGIDNDCDDAVDGADSDIIYDAEQRWYADTDNDNYGDPANWLDACSQPANYVKNDTDCDDTDIEINPSTPWYLDFDNDNFGDSTNVTTQCLEPPGHVRNNTDCDDTNPVLFPGQNWFPDCDDDTFYSDEFMSQCEAPEPDTICGSPGIVKLSNDTPLAANADCDDSNPDYNPSKTWYNDVDEDGFGGSSDPGVPCLPDDATDVTTNDDCDDTNSAYSPNETWYEDSDQDGFGNEAVSNPCLPGGPVNQWTRTTGDCYDLDPQTYPGAAIHDSTLACQTDEDQDGYGDNQPVNNDIDAGSDCDDSDAETYKGAAEVDSSTQCMRDSDQDGYGDQAVSGDIKVGTDCDDNNPLSTVLATDADCDSTVTNEDCDDDDFNSTIVATDLDCDSIINSADDDQDGDGVDGRIDCDDSDPLSTIVATDADCDGITNDNEDDDDDDGVPDIVDCDPLNSENTINSSLDQDCDGFVTLDDCDDNDPMSTHVAEDADCDGLVFSNDCDDNDPNATGTAEDADCDGVLLAQDCDDLNSSLGAQTLDQDCDGHLTNYDCDDNDSLSTVVIEDQDCDGTLTAADCDDNDAQSTIVATDFDCDSSLTGDDCDDNDPTLGNQSDDDDCDGITTALDCDDTDPLWGDRTTDSDCDQVSTLDDCDDNNSLLGDMALDADCDGTITAEDCNDNDDSSTILSTDADCDGTITIEDCDDHDALSTIIANDQDCDGVLTNDDCNDENPALLDFSNDQDCDGVTTLEDCNDLDMFSTTVATDADCDGTITAMDCDDHDSLSTTLVNDADCDGAIFAEDCDDNDPNSLIVAQDMDCDGIENKYDDDKDGDTYCELNSVCNAPGLQPGDCDDSRADVYPDAQEYCNEIDHDCDTIIWFEDDVAHDPLAYYLDIDGDTYIDQEQPNCCLDEPTCLMSSSASTWTIHDCNDNEPLINPAAYEVCDDGVDNNCDDIGIDSNTLASCFWDRTLTADDNYADMYLDGGLDLPVDDGAMHYGGSFGADGYPDLVIASASAREPVTGNTTGALQLVRGNMLTLTTYGNTEYGVNDGDRFGYTVAKTWNSNNDLEVDDLFVGAPGDDFLPGRVYHLVDPFLGASSITEVLIGSQNGDDYGFSIEALASAITSSNFAIGAPATATSTSQPGTVQLISERQITNGASSPIIATLTGQPSDSSGYSLAYLNLDNDLIGDLAIGAPTSNSGKGAVYLATDLDSGIDQNLQNTYLRLETSRANSRLGIAMVHCDLDGDSLEELVISAPGSAPNVPGRVYILDTPFNFSLVPASAVDIDTLATYVIEDTQNTLNNLGATIHCDQDLDNDQVPDLIISDPQNDSVYALLGPRHYTGSQSIDLIMNDPAYHSTVFEGTPNAEVGNRLVTGKIDEDLTADLCMTRPSNLGVSDPGQLFCFSGQGF